VLTSYALAAWIDYFERSRGCPSEGEPIFIVPSVNGGGAYRKDAISVRHLRNLERLKYIKRGGDRSARYGYNMHEFRDVSRPLLHLQGKRDGLDLECVEFWKGHVTDPNHYDKFYRDTDYTLKQYKIAEKYLNIMSGAVTVAPQDPEELEIILRNPRSLKKLSQALDPILGAKLAPIEET